MDKTLAKIVRNDWRRETGYPYVHAAILHHEIDPEGLDVQRIRFVEAGDFAPGKDLGHIVSLLQGSADLSCRLYSKPLHLGAGCHLYIPAGLDCVFHAESETELLKVTGAKASQAAGKKLLLRDEQFLSACATDNQSLRWILTPQYLSRRVFLHHDITLLSKSGNPVSWFRTTMFDVAGLPPNDVGEPVFKMSYNSRTEFNVCYDVRGEARVRMAVHPYKPDGQAWTPWFKLDSNSTYHLNESAGGPEEECYFDAAGQKMKTLRNRHEVYILDGYVSLFCMFDPAPTGSERHHPGEYSDYEPIATVLGTPAYETQQRELARFDRMVDELSLAKALGKLDASKGSVLWELYLRGRECQQMIEAQLAYDLIKEGNGREKVIEPWRLGLQRELSASG